MDSSDRLQWSQLHFTMATKTQIATQLKTCPVFCTPVYSVIQTDRVVQKIVWNIHVT